MGGWMDTPTIDVAYLYNWILFSLQKEGNSDTCYYMDETWGHDAENKPVTKGQIHYSIHMIYLEEINS